MSDYSLGPEGLASNVGNLYEQMPMVLGLGGSTYSYTNTGGGTSYECRATKIGTGGSGQFHINARLLKQGDLNYSNQIVDVRFEFHTWGSQPNNYNLYAIASNFNVGTSYFWTDSNRDLWFWNSYLWSLYNRIVIYSKENFTLDCSTTRTDMHTNGQSNNYSGVNRNAVNNGTNISIENTFGS